VGRTGEQVYRRGVVPLRRRGPGNGPAHGVDQPLQQPHPMLGAFDELGLDFGLLSGEADDLVVDVALAQALGDEIPDGFASSERSARNADDRAGHRASSMSPAAPVVDSS